MSAQQETWVVGWDAFVKKMFLSGSSRNPRGWTRKKNTGSWDPIFKEEIPELIEFHLPLKSVVRSISQRMIFESQIFWKKNSTVTQQCFIGSHVETKTLFWTVTSLLLMEEIKHHLGCVKPSKWWDTYHINWCRTSSINRMSISSNIFRGWGAHRPSSDSMISSALAVGKGGTRSCRFSHRKGPSDITYDDNTGRKSMVLYMKYPCSRYSNCIIISQSAMCRDSNSCSKQSMLVILYMSSCYLETMTVGLGEFECFLQSRTSEFVTIWNLSETTVFLALHHLMSLQLHQKDYNLRS